MSSYYYLDDPKSNLGYSSVSEEDFVRALFSIAKKYGLEITDELVLKELEDNKKSPKQSIAPYGKHTG